MSIELKNVSYRYAPNTPMQVIGLEHVSLTIRKGELLGIIGHTGSGKSTLIQHLNGLLRATDGAVLYNEENIYADGYDRRALRGKVGLVFQYPEHQLFETDVFSDVCFGPKNQKLPPEEITRRAREALSMVGLGEEYYARSPFDLSGGQKRRVAIAGVLAMQPEILVLDEPTAGLDPQGRDELLDQLALLKAERGIGVVLVSHSMEDVARYADRIVVMHKGHIVFDDKPAAVFSHYRELEQMGLSAPQVTYIMHGLRERGLPVDEKAATPEAAAESIWQVLQARAGKR